MNEMVKKQVFISRRERQQRFTYSACGPFRKPKERIQKFKGIQDSPCIYKNKLDKGCFQFDMDYGDFKDLISRISSDNKLPDKAFYIATKLKDD